MDGRILFSGPEKIFVSVTELNVKKRSWLVRPKQKSVGYAQDLFEKFSKPGELVADVIYGTFCTSKACFKFRGTVVP